MDERTVDEGVMGLSSAVELAALLPPLERLRGARSGVKNSVMELARRFLAGVPSWPAPPGDARALPLALPGDARGLATARGGVRGAATEAEVEVEAEVEAEKPVSTLTSSSSLLASMPNSRARSACSVLLAGASSSAAAAVRATGDSGER